MMNKILKAAMTVAATLFASGVYAQDVIVDPEVSYAGTHYRRNHCHTL